jgi:hypothetical protein
MPSFAATSCAAVSRGPGWPEQIAYSPRPGRTPQHNPLAWCDGPPFAYDYGLRTARAHLRALGAPAPEMPAYDASKHEPIEEIDIEIPEGWRGSGSGHRWATATPEAGHTCLRPDACCSRRLSIRGGTCRHSGRVPSTSAVLDSRAKPQQPSAAMRQRSMHEPCGRDAVGFRIPRLTAARIAGRLARRLTTDAGHRTLPSRRERDTLPSICGRCRRTRGPDASTCTTSGTSASDCRPTRNADSPTASITTIANSP